MNDPRVLAIILNYKTAPMTERAAAAALTAMDGIDGEVLIVDNDSGDGSFEALSAAIERHGWGENNRVRLIGSERNGGYGFGNNAGIREGLSDGSAPDFYYILNSDAFPAPGALHALLDALVADPKAGFAGSYIHSEDGTPDLTAFRFPSIASELEGAAKTGPITAVLRRWTIWQPNPETTAPVDWTCGASVLMRRQTLDDIGLFDETFFLYFEETDLCRRAWKAGWSTLYVRKSEVAHIGSVSTGMKSWARIPVYWLDSRLHYMVKNHGWLQLIGADLALVAGSSVWGLRRLLQNKPRDKPKGFLPDLLKHDFAALGRALTGDRRTRPTAAQSQPALK